MLASPCVLTQGVGLGKRDRIKDTETQRNRENSLVFPFMKTLKVLVQCSTLRAHLTLMGFTSGSDGKESALNVRERPGFYP